MKHPRMNYHDKTLTEIEEILTTMFFAFKGYRRNAQQDMEKAIEAPVSYPVAKYFQDQGREEAYGNVLYFMCNMGLMPHKEIVSDIYYSSESIKKERKENAKKEAKQRETD